MQTRGRDDPDPLREAVEADIVEAALAAFAAIEVVAASLADGWETDGRAERCEWIPAIRSPALIHDQLSRDEHSLASEKLLADTRCTLIRISLVRD